MNNLTEEYFESYRQKILYCKSMREELKELEKTIFDKNYNIRQLELEIANMQQIMTTMIDNDWDPVEAKLKMDSGDKMRSMWNAVKESLLAETGQKSTYSNSYGITGAIGAIGNNINQSYNSALI